MNIILRLLPLTSPISSLLSSFFSFFKLVLEHCIVLFEFCKISTRAAQKHQCRHPSTEESMLQNPFYSVDGSTLQQDRCNHIALVMSALHPCVREAVTAKDAATEQMVVL